MKPPPDTWLLFSDPAFDFEFRYPPVAPSGASVTVREHERSDRRRVHISTDDSRQVYFELENVDERTVNQGVTEFQSELRSRYPDATFGPLEPAKIAGEAATQFLTTFADRERLVLFSQVARPAHRVVLDPRSEVNHAILASLSRRE